MEHQNFDFSWKIAYERLVGKVRDQLELLEEPIVNGEISSSTLVKIIKKLIQDEQNKASSQLQFQLQSKPQSSASSQTDCAETFKPVTVNREEISKNVTEKETLKADSAPNPGAEVFDMENAIVETLNLDAEKIENANGAASQTAQTLNVHSQETDSNIESTDSSTGAIPNTHLEPNQKQNQDQREQEKQKQMKPQGNKRPFKCPKCLYRSKLKQRVQIHLKHVHARKPQTDSVSSRPFPCSHSGCNYAAKKKTHLTRHMTTHSAEKSFICSHPDCNFSTTRSDNLKIHTRNHTGEKPYVCYFQSCSYAATTSSQLVGHSRKHREENRFKCPEPNCEYSGRISSLASHRQSHLRKQKRKQKDMLLLQQGRKLSSFPCLFCEYKGKTQILLSSHLKTHSLEKPFACSVELCNYRCRTKGNLDNHLKTHNEERQYRCGLCPFRGKTRPTVVSHLKNVHSDPKSWSFKCKEPKCDFASRTKRHLERHLLTHSEKKKYACPFPGCEYLSLFKQHIKQHEIHSHTLEKKEQCPLCLYKCKTRSVLTIHMRTHTKEEPYKCKEPNCEYRAKQASALKAHQKKYHPQI